MALKFTKITDTAGCESAAQLAHSIWHQHYLPLIGQPQVDYMLKRFQSPEAIRTQIEAGSSYYIFSNDGDDVGYFAIEFDAESASAKLSKLYIDDAFRGKGYGTEALRFIEALCDSRQCERLWLTVNKGNSGSIAFYEARSFRRKNGIVMDIGGGFVMDDFLMEKRLPR